MEEENNDDLGTNLSIFTGMGCGCGLGLMVAFGAVVWILGMVLWPIINSAA